MIHTQIHYYEDLQTLEDFIVANITNSSKLLVQLFLISTDEEYISKIQSVVSKYLPDAHIIGATTDGSIVYKQDADVTSLSFTQFEKSTLKHTLIPFNIGAEDICANKILDDIVTKKTKVLLLFSDGLLCNAAKLTKSIHEKFENLVIAGGLAGDNAKLYKTLVCDNTTIASQAVVALSIESDSLYVHNDYNLAWQRVGSNMTITRCNENIIYEIDGEKATNIFEKHLNTKYLKHYDTAENRPTISIEFPLIIRRNNIDVARVVMKVNEDGSLFCTGEFKDGDSLHFSFTNTQQIIESGRALCKRMLKVPVQSIFVYSCMARRRFMGENIIHDLAPLQKIAPISGFYSYGEIYTTPKSVEMLNHTMTILSLSEEDDIYSFESYDSEKKYSKSSETLNALGTLISSSKEKDSSSADLVYDSKSMKLKLNEEVVKMSKSETQLFYLLHRNRNKALNSNEIFSYIWDDSQKEFSNDSVRALIKKLRKKLPAKSIENIYGGLYRLNLS